MISFNDLIRIVFSYLIVKTLCFLKSRLWAKRADSFQWAESDEPAHEKARGRWRAGCAICG